MPRSARSKRMATKKRPTDHDATPRCKRCGRKIVWGVDGQGKKIPLDPTPACYSIWRRDSTTAYIDRERSVMVSHFAVCSKTERGL